MCGRGTSVAPDLGQLSAVTSFAFGADVSSFTALHMLLLWLIAALRHGTSSAVQQADWRCERCMRCACTCKGDTARCVSSWPTIPGVSVLQLWSGALFIRDVVPAGPAAESGIASACGMLVASQAACKWEADPACCTSGARMLSTRGASLHDCCERIELSGWSCVVLPDWKALVAAPLCVCEDVDGPPLTTLDHASATREPAIASMSWSCAIESVLDIDICALAMVADDEWAGRDRAWRRRPACAVAFARCCRFTKSAAVRCGFEAPWCCIWSSNQLQTSWQACDAV